MEVKQMTAAEILHDFSPRFRVYKDGQIERLLKAKTIAPSFDSISRVHSKDVTISHGVSARIFMPDNKLIIHQNTTKLPLLIYIHGGAFCVYSASSSMYHNYVTSIVSNACCIAVSVDYRLAPEHPLPVCYEDSWVVARWVMSHSDGLGPDPWINEWADFGRVYLGGDSAGANIAHDLVVRAGPMGFEGNKSGLFKGIVLVHPFFGDGEPDRLWDFLYPGSAGVLEHPRLNPGGNPSRMWRELVGCKRALVCVGGRDFLRERGVKYYEVLREGIEKGEWEGEVEFMESKGRGHVFHLYKPESFEAKELLNKVVDFINRS